MQYTKPLAKLIEAFQKLPSIGPKSAQRIAYYLLKGSEEDAVNLAQAILAAKKEVKNCSVCYNLTASDPCELCADSRREKQSICVVAEPRDIVSIERSRAFKGYYHVLGGLISPMEGIGHEELRIKELIERLSDHQVKEVILALNPTIEGEATSLYLSRLIKPSGIRVSRIAFGLPVGSDMEYADELTLSSAIEGRREI